MPEAPARPPLPPRSDDDDTPPLLADGDDAPTLPGYAQLHTLSNFSFQRGASHPGELVRRAYNLGYEALALTDECSVAGVVQAHVALREHLQEAAGLERESPGRRVRAFRLLWGSEFLLPGGRLVALARNTFAWGDLCEFITAARRQAPKGTYAVDWATSDWALLAGCECLWVPRRDTPQALSAATLGDDLRQVQACVGGRLWLGVALSGELGDDLWLTLLRQVGAQCGVPLVAADGVVMHRRSRQRLHDVMTAVHEGRPIAECGFALPSNAQRHLRYRARLAQVYPPELLDATRVVAARCRFELDAIQYNYPLESVPRGQTPIGALTRLTLRGARRRYPQGLLPAHRAQIAKELQIIAAKRYEMFFLTVEDIVRFARSQGILCQGRGSSANSLVCYCLHITEVSPERSSMLFERFISMARHEAPDIDVDFEHQRREEVIQYIYRKYGRERAAIVAVVVRYRPRMALRDVGKALGIDERLIDAFAHDPHGFERDIASDRLAQVAHEVGVALSRTVRLWLQLARELCGFPRHLSQHVGGFVLTQDKLTRLVPVENAAMPDRSIIQWEKGDLEAMGLLKVDVLALGMLSALRRGLDLANTWRGRHGEAAWHLQHIPPEDPRVYDMLCHADSVGVFQVESRAQMAMLPRLLPRTYYDLVVQVAIVRPGPIQGGMVHPYLQARQRRREGRPITYIQDELAGPLGRTLGVPIFQEQVMQLAMVAAQFTADQADALRRSMVAWSRQGGVHKFRQPLVEGMVRRGYPQDFAEGIFRQIEGFGEYGFPESHAASFALLVYFSSWLKCHEPACFLAAMLNSHPLGFYTPSQLVQDAQRHGVQVRPVDVTASDWDCTLEPVGVAREAHEPTTGEGNTLQPAVRLGLRLVAGLGEAAGARIAATRREAVWGDAQDLALRAGLDRADMGALASADALSSLAGHRRQQVWAATAIERAPGLLREAPIHEDLLQLPLASEGEDIVFDHASTGLTLRRHPLALLRARLDALRWHSAQRLDALVDGQAARACGIVTMRQRPGTAKGTLFISLEDETGTVNVIVWPALVDAQRDVLMRARLLAVEGVWQRDASSGGRVRHLVARRSEDLTPLLGRLAQQGRSRDFH
jgi:error-prone DNA polymerase